MLPLKTLIFLSFQHLIYPFSAKKNEENNQKQHVDTISLMFTLTIGEILETIDRNVTEEELWALCKEGSYSLQRKKKHLRKYSYFCST
jgi:hypothetical protein